MKTLLSGLVILLTLSVVPVRAQEQNLVKRYLNNLINDTTPVSKPRLLAYPTLAYSPETKLEFGLSGLYVYYAQEDTTNRLSEVNAFAFYTLENQYGFWLDHTLYTNESKWIFPGRFRYQSFPILYYGIGPDSPAEHVARVDAKQLQVRERALRQVYGNLYLGPQLDFQRLSSVEFVSSAAEFIQKPTGSAGSSNLGLGIGIMYDKRHNVLNVRDGIYAELALLHYDKAWGSDFGFTSITSDNRFYKSLSERNVLAAQVLGQFNTGDIPFNQLAMLGGESINRGYYLGRFRDNNHLAAQVEYRMLSLPFSNRWGAAVFGSTGTVFDKFSHLSADKFVWSGGGGIRFLMFPKKDIYTRVDVAFTKEKPGIYIFIGEAF